MPVPNVSLEEAGELACFGAHVLHQLLLLLLVLVLLLLLRSSQLGIVQ
jgi:aspartokinase